VGSCSSQMPPAMTFEPSLIIVRFGISRHIRFA
jgi:hypothetical protein